MPQYSRRHVVSGIAVGGLALPLLAACGGGSTAPAAPKKGSTLARTSAIPVGGGKVFGAEQIVVTQPAKGEFKAFSAVCTHQGCLLDRVADNLIQCPCHGSEFSAKDGSNVRGPNGTSAGSVPSLAAEKITVQGGEIRLA